MAYSLIQTCKCHGVASYAYLADVLRRLPAHPINRVAELLRFRWKSTAYVPLSRITTTTSPAMPGITGRLRL